MHRGEIFERALLSLAGFTLEGADRINLAGFQLTVHLRSKARYLRKVKDRVGYTVLEKGSINLHAIVLIDLDRSKSSPKN